MPLQPEELATVRDALNGPAPAWDPEWKVTSALLETILKQQQMIRLFASDIAILDETRRQTHGRLVAVLQQTRTVSGEVRPPPISASDADRVAAEMDAAINARKTGTAIISVASTVLKLVATVL